MFNRALKCYCLVNFNKLIFLDVHDHVNPTELLIIIKRISLMKKRRGNIQ